ncbi:head-tail connector protein [Consotaella salsifontis]|uniref:Phage gp6-like head-tail connector protein n=1 Tax=Consotaella salsifontis TaxID=1365950 RepID=A0A1T4MEL3_9HYPH|nr:head-tail connector protein [Consotaella salsifontis]SJZ65325.1 phage conserved hypothetical protein, phiE125 gp8 family [Consotaella salsifontis]
MTIIDLSPGLDGPLTLAEIKSWCRIDRDDEDELLSCLARAARETVEAMTGSVLARRTFRLCLDALPTDGWIEVKRRPLAAVTAVTAYDAKGRAIAFEPADAVIERELGIEAIRLSPAVRAAAVNGAEVEFEAGYEEGVAPDGLRLALLKIVAASYEVRGAVAAEMQPALIPPSARALIDAARPARL